MIKNYPSLEVDINGVPTTLYVQYPEWAKASTSGDVLSFNYNHRMYLSTQETLDPSKYYRANLLGGSVEFDIDLSNSGCGCLTALYTVRMPGVDSTSDSFKYCDGMAVGGSYCPEFDILEANKFSYRATSHACSAPNASGVYSSCDRNGSCSVDILTNPQANDFGPGASYTIDTQKAFHVKQSYLETDGQFSGYTTEFSQEGRSVWLNQLNCAGLNGITADMRDMVLVFSNWGSDSLDWLQHGVCSGSCSTTATSQTFTNLKITTK